jgi:hypothetical protein
MLKHNLPGRSPPRDRHNPLLRSFTRLTFCGEGVVLSCQGVRCDCLVDGALTGTPQEASGRFPWWEPVAGRYLTGQQRAFFARIAARRPSIATFFAAVFSRSHVGHRLARPGIAQAADRHRQGHSPDLPWPILSGTIERLDISPGLSVCQKLAFGRLNGHSPCRHAAPAVRPDAAILHDPDAIPVFHDNHSSCQLLSPGRGLVHFSAQ